MSDNKKEKVNKRFIEEDGDSYIKIEPKKKDKPEK